MHKFVFVVTLLFPILCFAGMVFTKIETTPGKKEDAIRIEKDNCKALVTMPEDEGYIPPLEDEEGEGERMRKEFERQRQEELEKDKDFYRRINGNIKEKGSEVLVYAEEKVVE